MVDRTVLFDAISYQRGDNPDGSPAFGTANRGDTVELTKAEAKRLDELGATADPDSAEAQEAEEGTEPAPFEPVDDEQLRELSVDGVTDYLRQVPEDQLAVELDRVDAAEEARGEGKRRKGVDDLLADYQAAGAGS